MSRFERVEWSDPSRSKRLSKPNLELRQHSREGLGYETDLTTREWRVIGPYLPPCSESGRPRTWPPREIVTAIFAVRRGSIAWRLPPSDLPTWQTVHHRFAAWRDQSVFEKISHALVMVDRERAGGAPSPPQPSSTARA